MADFKNSILNVPVEKAIEFILNQKDINISDVGGKTLLHWSVCRDDGIPLVELLLYLGIDKERENVEKQTASFVA